MLQLYVSTNHRSGHFIPHRPYKVAVAPQLSSPQLLPQFGVTTEQFPCRDTLDDLHHPAGTVLGRRRKKQVDAIGHYLQGVNLQPISRSNAVENLFQALSHRPFQDKLAVFRNPNKVVLQVINRMFGTFNRIHPAYGNGRIRLRRISAFLPPAKLGGIQRRFLMNYSAQENSTGSVL